jgi:hypothetical protein
MNGFEASQIMPLEIINQGFAFLQEGTESNRQIAYLLFDVGVETIFKTFLSQLENTPNGNQLNDCVCEKVIEGNFHELVAVIQEVAKDRLEGFDLKEVENHHNLRNTSFHQGEGIVPSTETLEQFADASLQLLHRLLSVDLRYLDVQSPEQHSNLVSETNLNGLKIMVGETIGKL